MSKNKTVSSTSFNRAIGVFLSLFSLLLFLNTGYVIRTLSFPFLFLFGNVSYLVYVYIFIQGLSLIIKDHTIYVKRSIKIISSILIFVSLLVLTTYISRTSNDLKDVVFTSLDEDRINFIKAFNTEALKGFYDSRLFLDVFNSHPFGGGILGYLLTALCNQFISPIGGWIISITSLVVGVGLFALPEILLLVKKQIEKQGLPVGKDQETKPIKFKRIKNVDVIKDASKIKKSEEVEESSPVFDEIKVVPVGQVDTSTFAQLNGVFSPFKMTLSSDEPKQSEIATFTPPSLEITKEGEDHPTIAEPKKQEIIIEDAPTVKEQLNIFSTSEEVFEEEEEAIEEVTPIVERVEPVKMKVNTQKRIDYIPPSLDLLNDFVNVTNPENEELAKQTFEIINSTFKDFKIGAQCVGYTIGPSVTRYHIQTNPGVYTNTVNKITPNLSIALGGVNVLYEQIIPGQSYSGFDIPNAVTSSVSFREAMEALPPIGNPKTALAVPFGKDISGNVIQANFNEFPHCLVAGTTGSGKSIFIHTIILSLMMRNSPDDLKFVMIDPKQVELTFYEDTPHLLTPIITDPIKAKNVLNKLVDEMERRYSLIRQVNVQNLSSYEKIAKENGLEHLPYIAVVFDEYADMIEVCKEIAQPVSRLAAKARGAGIHMLIATQRPSTNVVTGVLKSNLPTRFALMCSSYFDSNVIIGQAGAEKLLGKGDMLVQSNLITKIGCVHLQSPFVSEDEIKNVVSYLKSKYEVNYDHEYDDIEDKSKDDGGIAPGTGSFEDELYATIKEWAMAQEYASISRIQREFAVGFTRAGRLFKQLQDDGIVASAPDTASSAKGCRVLVRDKFSDSNED